MKNKIEHEYEIIPDKTPYAILIGAFTGAITLQALYIVFLLGGSMYMTFFEHAKMGDTFSEAFIQIAFGSLLIGIGAFFVFLFGLIVLGIPAWWLLHRYGFRKPRHAISLGFLLTFFVVLFMERPNAYLALFGEKHVPASLLIGPILYSAVISLISALVGFVIWRYSYYRAEKNPESKAEAPAA
jgi:hypothetical protein